RISELHQAKAKIMQDRAAGRLAAEQGSRLALISADTEILEAELAKREGDAKRAAEVLDDSQAYVNRLEQALADIEHQAELNGVIQKLREIEGIYLAAINRALELRHKSRPGRPDLADLARVFAPRPDLCDLARKLDLNRQDGARGANRLV